MILDLLRLDPTHSATTLGAALGLSKRRILAYTQQLQEQGRLRRVGAARGGHWEVLE